MDAGVPLGPVLVPVLLSICSTAILRDADMVLAWYADDTTIESQKIIYFTKK